MTAKQAAEQAGVSVSLVYEWCKAGVLSHSRFGRPGKRGTIRIHETDLQAFLAACRQEGRGPEAPALQLKHIALPQPS